MVSPVLQLTYKASYPLSKCRREVYCKCGWHASFLGGVSVGVRGLPLRSKRNRRNQTCFADGLDYSSVDQR